MYLTPIEEVLENLDKIDAWCLSHSWRSYRSCERAIQLRGNVDLEAKCLRMGTNLVGEPFPYNKKRELLYRTYLAEFELLKHMWELEQEEEKEAAQ